MRKSILLFILMLMPLLANAAPVEIKGIYYNLVSKVKTAEVTLNPNKYSGEVVIPKTVTYGGNKYTVTSIGSSAFQNCRALTSITIPNSVTSIGSSAFQNCRALTSINIPNSVTAIKDYAFYNCSGLTSVTIPNSVTHLSGFSGCTGLTSVTIPNSVTSIGYGAFQNCTGLTSITISNSVTTIGDYAFQNCKGLTSITIPNSVTKIGEEAFSRCTGLTSITIPNSVTSIDCDAFYGCSGLTSVIIPNSVTSLSCFSGCTGLTSITIPNSVTSIGSSAFSGCTGLTSVTIPNSVTHLSGFSGCTGLTSVTIPNSVTSIGESAFYGCSGLTSVIIPNSVTSIGEYAFSGCTLTSITIPNSVTHLSGFSGCTGLTSITIPNSVTSIGSFAFSGCTGLTSITIPNSVSSIGYYAFKGCSGLTSATIGCGIENIRGYAFANCPKLKDVYCYAKNIPSTDIDAFEGSYVENVTLHVPKGCLDAYMAVEPWKSFKSILEMADAKVKLSKAKAAIEKGKTLTLKATVTPSDLPDKSVSWKSSNTKIATVTSKGKVKGVKAGTATITCISNSTGAKATCKVTVGYVKLDKTEVTVKKGKTMTLKATVTPETLTDKSVTWESSDKKIATVTKAGKVKGVKYGTATITCTSVATGAKATCQVTVGKVVIGTSEVTIKKSRETILIPFLYPEDLADKSVTWKSSDKSIATVNEEGRVMGIMAGTATITCTSVATGLKGTCTVTVLSNSEARSMIGDDDELTDIKELESSAAAEPFDVYDLSGRKVLHQVTSLDGLSEGIYIVNGKKILKK